MESENHKRTIGPCEVVRLGRATCIAIALALWLGSGMLGVKGAERQNATNSWKLATEDTEVVLVVKDGWPMLEALRSTATHRNWLSSPLPIKDVLMKSVKLEGVSKDLNWKFEGADLDPKGEQLSLHFSNSSPKLSLDSIWRARSGHGPVEHWLTMTNESGYTITVPQQESLVLTNLMVPSKESAQAWWIKRGGNEPSHKGGTFTVDLDSDFDQVLLSDPTDESSPVPWMTVQVGQHEGLYVGWEFSGIGGIHARTTSTDPRRFELRVGLPPDFRTDIPASETFLAPPAFVGCYEGDVDDGSYTLHRFILEKLLPPLPQDQPYPAVTCNQYLDFGGYNKAREADVISHAAFCKQLGFETFVPDCLVWFPKMGDWRWDPARFPRGGEPIEEYTHQSGMKLGFWMAWTHMGDSIYPGALNVFRHPDWSIEKLTPEWKMDADSWGTTMDLGFDPARDWAEHEVERVVGENHLDYLKHDYTPIVTECVQTNHRHHYGVDVSYWSTLGYYHVMEALKQRYPNLVLEGCSGGGHIKDFGYIKRVHYIVTTDTLSALPDRQSIYDSTFAFPPAVLLAYTYENMYNKDADQPRPYLWRSATMSGWVIAPVHSANWSPDEIAGAQRATEIFKSWIRPILRDVKVHHILPRPDGFRWDGMFYWSPSLKRGTLYVFRPNNDQAEQRIRLKGLTPEAQYRVRSEDGSVREEIRAGNDLMSTGLKVKLPGKYSSDLIYLEQSK